ncbi:hypothetical protein H2O64_15075 [Kordia sp. YSTF-M3]|uniref:Calx-beta domain-containing protein n=1 Tax=Kordia aestuariivivens TaxID=2759037 RepID=A0ABR7QBY8_9FLAO|nr:Calx-beta domain-containing protein [Kordia aestuariivivens]MBC8755998.1 hypothetical protein [Kordia aestuariivivens]
MKKILLFLSCLLVLSFFSCENDDNSTVPVNEEPPININFEENFGTTISARFLGRVVNEQNEPIQGATIRIGNAVTSTDIFGIFSVSDVTAFEKFAYITAEKDGYIIGSRALAPSASEVNRVEIMLLKEDVIATINTGQQATVNLSNGTEVTFDGNFTKEDGSAYNGDVNVILKHLSPDDENMDTMMPGMLFAQDASGGAVALETYGMLAVELRSGSGEELQLADGSTSQISMPLAANVTNPPATIPLWHFDEVAGYWIEEGEATLQGNMYVGDVSHFSFWNYDYPYPSVYLCIELQDENGNPMSYTPLDLYSTLLNSTGTYGYTNANGVECGLVPAGEELTVIVPGVSCNNDPFTTTIGPFTTSTTTTVTVVANNQNTSTITGTFVSCDGNNVTDGYIQLFINNQTQIIPVTDGTINYTISYCGTLDYSLKGIDVANNQVTDVISGTLNGAATLDLATLSSCTGFVDSDGDGIFDSFEDLNGDNDLTNDDTDQDGVPNYLDADDDGDGIDTADEDYDGDNDPTNDDSDGDQIPDYLDAQDVVVFTVEVLGTGCDPVSFDLDATVTQFGNNLHTYAFYLTQADAAAGTSPLSSPFGVPIVDLVGNTQMIFIVATNIASGQSATGIIYLYWSYVDSDGDGLTDCEETTGIDNPSTGLTPNGISDPNDPNDPYQQPIDITLSVDNNVTASEGDGAAVINIYLSQTSTVDTTIDVTTIDGSAIDPDDYVSTVSVITIPAGGTLVTLSIPIVDDTLVEPNETFTFVATVTSGNTLNNVADSIITIIDNDGTGGNFPQSGDLATCDDNGNGVGVFDLTSMDAYYLNGNSGTVTYHQTQADANANIAPLSSPATVGNGFTLFVRIDSLGIVQISILNLVVNSIPTAPTGLSLTACDGNGDGIATFDLSQLNVQIVQTQPSLQVTYHETQADADNNINAIPTTYTNTTSPQTIFYRVEDPQTGCFNTGTIDLIVDPSC